MKYFIPQLKTKTLQCGKYLGCVRDGVLVKGTPVCRACGATVIAKGGNTTNLTAHLYIYHTNSLATTERTSKVSNKLVYQQDRSSPTMTCCELAG